MTNATMTLLVAVSATSAVCYVLMTRLQNRRARRTSPDGRSSGDSGNFSDGNGWIAGSWFGHSTSHDSNSCGGGWDSGGGSDCGGSDGGGGGDGGGH